MDQDKKLVQALYNLYVTTNKKYIYQQINGGYAWIDVCKGQKQLQYWQLFKHLQHLPNATIGVFSGKVFTKFICFDVDTGEESKNDTRYLVGVLNQDYGIDLKDIHVSYSGKKGYHIELFFGGGLESELLTLEFAESFYKSVIETCNFNPDKVEFRPTNNQGVKIPLGIHQLSKNKCCFVDNITLEPLPDEYILGIEKLDSVEFTNKYGLDHEETLLSYEESKAHEFDCLMHRQNTEETDLIGHIKNIELILADNSLIEPRTRHKYTYLIPMYLRGNGYAQNETESILNSIMMNTIKEKPGYIKTDIKTIQSEIKRLTEYVYKNNKQLVQPIRDIEITKDEMDYILTFKEWHIKQLLLSMMIHSKRYSTGNGIFYMTYETMARMGNTNNRNSLKKYIDKLCESDVIEVVAKNVVDSIRSKQEGRIIKVPNKYRIKKCFNNDSAKVIIKADTQEIELKQILIELYDLRELKTRLNRRQYEKVAI